MTHRVDDTILVYQEHLAIFIFNQLHSRKTKQDENVFKFNLIYMNLLIIAYLTELASFKFNHISGQFHFFATAKKSLKHDQQMISTKSELKAVYCKYSFEVDAQFATFFVCFTT